MLIAQHWQSMREIFGDPDLGLPPSNSPEADEQYTLGVSLMKQSKTSEAEQAFRRADELGHAGAPRELANWAVVRGDMDLSGEWGDLMRRARERGDGRAASWIGRAMRDSDQGLDHLRFSDESGDPEGSRELGLALKARGDFAEAEAAFRRADQRGSASGSLAMGLFLRDERNHLRSAEAAFRRAEQRGHPKGALNLIDLYSDRGDSVAADEARERTIELAAKHPILFADMQGPDFAEYVWRVRGKTAATTTTGSGSGCAITAVAAFAAGVSAMIVL